ncbi:MAG: iron chelate uptake ABC transporter family permease subunit [Pseudomonadota bacterium]|nr:iron chelate uptake ABC transporter family permease subunit [Pseudomonadota bacterium]
MALSDIILLMLPALVACLVLTGIHVYLGVHVLARGVIFVDLALAQVAALGATFALMLGSEPDSAQAYFVSLGFTMVGAALFTYARRLSDRVPVEAIIGIVYAVASASAIILADRLPHGAEEIREILVGNLLAVTWPHIAKTVGIYAVVGIVHYVFRRQFFLVSMDPKRAEAEGLNIARWDLLFYLSFGFVITSSVAIGGVLIVFSYLVIPAVIVALFARSTTTRLLAGWGVGFVGSFLGMVASFQLDLPTGAAVVATFGVMLVLAIIVSQLLPRKALTGSVYGTAHDRRAGEPPDGTVLAKDVGGSGA